MGRGHCSDCGGSGEFDCICDGWGTRGKLINRLKEQTKFKEMAYARIDNLEAQRQEAVHKFKTADGARIAAETSAAALKEALQEALADLSSQEYWCGGALSYTDEGDGMGCSPACRHRKECGVLHGRKE